MELIDFMDTDNSSLSDLGDSAASSSSRLYHVVDKDGNFKEMYSGYAGDVIKDDNYFEVITE